MPKDTIGSTATLSSGGRSAAGGGAWGFQMSARRRWPARRRKDRLGRISKMGDGYLRKLLVVGATSVIRRARTSSSTSAVWINSLLERRPARVVTVAMANKTARIAWAVLKRGEVYRPPAMA